MHIPYPFQQTAIDHGVRENLLIADQTGLGKSLIAAEIIKRCLDLYRGAALVIVPKQLVVQWIAYLMVQAPHLSVIRGTKEFSPLCITDKCVIVTHYEVVVAAADRLCQVGWTVVVCDEAHRIKTRSTVKKPIKRTAAVKAVSKNAFRKIALTGTPYDKDPAELWSILNWLFPSRYTSYWQFRNKHTDEIVLPSGWLKVQGVKDPAALARELAPFSYFRTKKEVAPELPDRIDRVEFVEMSPAQAKLYKEVRDAKDIELLVDGKLVDIPNALAHIVRLLQVTSCPSMLGFNVPSAKIEWCEQFVADHSNLVVVFFCRFRKTAETLAEKLNAALLIGGADDDAAKPFLRGEVPYLVGTFGAMKEGLNLQIASVAVMVDSEWSSTIMRQAFDRIHRIDIKEPKQIISLLASPTDRLVHKAWTHKVAVAELVREHINALRSHQRHSRV